MKQYISIKVVADNVMRHPLLQDISFEQIISYVVDFIKIIGAPKIFTQRIEVLELKDYRAPLPCDLVEIIQVKDLETCRCMRSSTDNFVDSRGQNLADLTFKTQGGIIYSNKKRGNIEVSYRAVVTDEEGYPMIPDNSKVLRAIEAYIKRQWFTILFDLGKITTPVLQNAQQDYAFYVAQASNDLIMPTLSEMESITNAWNTLIPRVNEFKTGFRYNGAKELIKVQS